MPNKIPPLGLSAVPLPMKNRKMLPGCHPPIADAAGDATAAAGPTSDTTGSAGSPLDVLVAAALAEPRSDSNSRRAAANAAHPTGPDPGATLPPPNQATRLPLKPATAPVAAERGDAVITGATAAGATDSAAGIDGAESPPSASTGSMPDGGAADVRFDDAVSEVPPSGPGSSLVLPAPADTTGPPRGSGSGTAPAPALRGVPGPLGRAAEPSPGDLSSADLLAGNDLEPDAPESDPRRLESTGEPPPAEPLRAPDRADRDDADDVEDPDDDVPAEFDPVDPDDPVVSANANGTDEIADPTPRATASAPTRPT